MGSRFRVNPHVERLKRYLPFVADATQLYEELVDPADRVDIPTQALEFLRRLTREESASVAILTGDAGHGKTHLCRRILEDYGAPTEEVVELLRGRVGATEAIPDRSDAGRRPVRVVFDLSEIDPIDRAAAILEELQADENTLSIICANEGRLRDVISARPEGLEPILKALDTSVADGATMHPELPAVHVLNMNFQSVTGRPHSFVAQLIRTWAQDDRRWRSCKDCAASDWCPIYANRTHITRSIKEEGSGVVTGLEKLLRVAEQSGYVLTIRETLMLGAFILVGDLDCRGVESHGEAQADEHWRREKSFPELLFSHPLRPSERAQFPIISRLRKLDPGFQALREVDDRLVQHLAAEVETRAPSAPPATRSEQRKKTDKEVELVRIFRRQDFFGLIGAGSDAVSQYARLGLFWWDDFERLAEPELLDPYHFRSLRNRLLDGLQAVQGIRPIGNPLAFFLVDPAFSRGGAAASLVARRMARKEIQISGLRSFWSVSGGSRVHAVEDTVDWVDRQIVVEFGGEHPVRIDAMSFEVVMRAGRGTVFRRFFTPEIRRLLSHLAQVAESGSTTEEIKLVEGTRLTTLAIDMGTIVVGGD